MVAFLVRRLPLVGQAQDELFLSNLGGRDEVVVQFTLLAVLFLHTSLSTITIVFLVIIIVFDHGYFLAGECVLLTHT